MHQTAVKDASFFLDLTICALFCTVWCSISALSDSGHLCLLCLCMERIIFLCVCVSVLLLLFLSYFLIFLLLFFSGGTKKTFCCYLSEQ